MGTVTSLFQTSARLDLNSLKDYFESLVQIVLESESEEIGITALLKLTESIGYTMDRSASEWKELWPLLSSKLVTMVQKFFV